MTETPFALLADEIRRQAKWERELADDEDRRSAEKRQIAEVLDAVAELVQSGQIWNPEQMGAALEAARPSSWSSFGKSGDETPADKLRRVFHLVTGSPRGFA